MNKQAEFSFSGPGDDHPAEIKFGTPPHKLSRRGDPDTSKAAAGSVNTTALEKSVYEVILSFGPGGCISDEVRLKFPAFPYSSITARYRALLDKGLIVDSGRRRAGDSGRGQRIMIANEFVREGGVMT